MSWRPTYAEMDDAISGVYRRQYEEALEEEGKVKAAEKQPDPMPGCKAVGPLVLADMQARIDAGMERYRRPLETFNGRDALWDAYQEALDLCMYLRQVIEEGEGDTDTD